MSDLLKQWQDDCERLSEPHKQYEFKYFVTGEFMQCTDKYAVELLIHDWMDSDCCLDKKQEIRRIDSLALPFDYKDAENGGLVECLRNGIAYPVTDLIFPDRADYAISGVVDGVGCTFFNRWNLRMKESRLKTTGANNG